jgi:hypothetical protein
MLQNILQREYDNMASGFRIQFLGFKENAVINWCKPLRIFIYNSNHAVSLSDQPTVQVLSDPTISVYQNFRVFIEIKCSHWLRSSPEVPFGELPGQPFGSFNSSVYHTSSAERSPISLRYPHCFILHRGMA